MSHVNVWLYMSGTINLLNFGDILVVDLDMSNYVSQNKPPWKCVLRHLFLDTQLHTSKSMIEILQKINLWDVSDIHSNWQIINNDIFNASNVKQENFSKTYP